MNGASHPLPDAERAALRLAHEPYRYFDEACVHRLLTRDPPGYREFLREGIAAIARGECSVDLPPKQLFADPDGGGDFRVMPCVVRGRQGSCKTVKVIGTNLAQRAVPGQITVGKALALHPEENFVTDIFEACLLSSARTGACAAIALELLARRRSRVLIVGAGRVGFYAALYAASLPGVSELVLADRDAARSAATLRALRARLPGVPVSAAALSRALEVDAAILATSATVPVCAPPGWGACLIASLGADTDDQSELDPAWAGTAPVFVDTLDSARFGDLRAWIAAGRIERAAITDFAAVLRAGAAPGESAQKLFVSTGSALFDNLTIAYLLRESPAGQACGAQRSNRDRQ